MMIGVSMMFLALLQLASAVCSDSPVDQSCTASSAQAEEVEQREVEASRLEMLQKPGLEYSLRHDGQKKPKGFSDLGSLGGDHRFLLVRPCARFVGDGMSGLPRHRVTGDCCGDEVCSPSRWETVDTCPGDCGEAREEKCESPGSTARALLPPTQTTLFGELQELEHDEYHCEAMYNATLYGCGCSCDHHRPSLWLEDLLNRSQAKTLPFELPPQGSVAVEVGCGVGQDSRNMAKLAGWAMTSVDVSPEAIKTAKNETPAEMLGSGAGQVEFVAYDGMALPAPKERVDFFFDATVYCGLRHKYLARDYGVWSRIGTPGHTLFSIQCWNDEAQDWRAAVPRTRHDMEVDFEPMFDVLHSEECEKNQGGAGWCFYMKLKAPEVRQQIFDERLKLQHAVRDGDIEYVREKLSGRSDNMSDAERHTLYYIAFTNSRSELTSYLSSLSRQKDDEFFSILYGKHAEKTSIETEDQMDGSDSAVARWQMSYIKEDWERREAELMLDNKIKLLGGEGYSK